MRGRMGSLHAEARGDFVAAGGRRRYLTQSARRTRRLRRGENLTQRPQRLRHGGRGRRGKTQSPAGTLRPTHLLCGRLDYGRRREKEKDSLHIPRPGPTISPKEEPLPLCCAETLCFTTCAAGCGADGPSAAPARRAFAKREGAGDISRGVRGVRGVLDTQRTQCLCAAQRYPWNPCHPCETIAPEAGAAAPRLRGSV